MRLINDGHFCHFGPFFAHLPPLKNDKKKTPGKITILQMCTCTIHENYMMYVSWVQWTEFYVILDHFLPFYPNNNTHKKKLKKWKKCLDICHVTHMYQKSWSNDHILNCSWDTRHDRCNFYFPFWDIFCCYSCNNPKK